MPFRIPSQTDRHLRSLPASTMCRCLAASASRCCAHDKTICWSAFLPFVPSLSGQMIPFIIRKILLLRKGEDRLSFSHLKFASLTRPSCDTENLVCEFTFPAKNASLFEFLNICPEPVLAK